LATFATVAIAKFLLGHQIKVDDPPLFVPLCPKSSTPPQFLL
jgi:hypothetical protein